MLAVVIFLFDKLRKKRSVSLTPSQVLHALNILEAYSLEVSGLEVRK